MKKKLIVLSGFALSLAPVIAFAQTATTNQCSQVRITDGNIQGVICEVAKIMNFIIPVLIILAILYFIWGIVSYVVGGDAEAKAEGRTRMIYGIIGLAVIVGMWGLVFILGNTFGIQSGAGKNVVPILPNTVTP